MPSYKRKEPSIVEAIQSDPQDQKPLNAFLVEHELFFKIQGATVTVEADPLFLKVAPQQWILVFENGLVQVLKDQEFTDQYELVA